MSHIKAPRFREVRLGADSQGFREDVFGSPKLGCEVYLTGPPLHALRMGGAGAVKIFARPILVAGMRAYERAMSSRGLQTVLHLIKVADFVGKTGDDVDALVRRLRGKIALTMVENFNNVVIQEPDEKDLVLDFVRKIMHKLPHAPDRIGK